MSEFKLWNHHLPWKEAEENWNAQAQKAATEHPLKVLKNSPNMTGITPETARFLKWKSFRWMITQDHTGEIRRGFLKHPFKYAWKYILSLFKKKSFHREKDFFYYGIKNLKEFQKLLTNRKNLLVLGFSYCHKPFECPSGRFTPDCIRDPHSPVCQQCFIGKAIDAASPEENTISLVIPTVHYIGGKIFDIVHKHPKKKILFMITACEMTLEMFGDWGNMVDIKGIGVRLDGRICNTMKAFELSEKGIKPGLTMIRNDTQQTMMDLIKMRTHLSQNHTDNAF